MNPPGPSGIARGDLLCAVGVSLVAVALYSFTMPRTVTMEDSGLFLMSARFAGTAHSPGFPVYTLLGHLFSLLPIGSVAVRVHLLSAVSGAGTVALVVLIARRLGSGAVAAATAGALLAFSPAFWSQSIVAEVYTLNALFTFACVWCVLELAVGGRRGFLWAAAVLYGLGLGNSWPLMLLVTPGVLLLLWPRLREVRGLLGPAALALLTAALSYGYLVLRSFQELPYNFHSPIYSLRYFWSILTRQAYEGLYEVPLQERFWSVQFHGTELLDQFTVVGALLLVLGFLLQWRYWRAREAVGMTLVFLATTLVVAWVAAMEYSPLARATHRAYALPAYAVGALWISLALERLVLGRPARRLAAVLVAVLAVALFAWHFPANDRRDDTLAADYGRAILESLEQDAVLFTLSEMDAGPVGHLHLVEGVRPDVAVFNHQGLFFPGGPYPAVAPEPDRRRLLEQFVREAGRPVHLVGGLETWPGGTRDPLPFGSQDHGLLQSVSTRWPEGRRGVKPLAALDAFVTRALDATGEKDPYAEHLRDMIAHEYGRLVATLVLLSPDSPQAAQLAPQMERLQGNYRGLLSMLDAMHRRGDPERLWEWAEQARRMEQEHRYHYRFRAHVAYLRGVVLLRRGPEYRDEAVGELRRSLEIMPEKKSAADLLEALEREESGPGGD